MHGGHGGYYLGGHGGHGGHGGYGNQSGWQTGNHGGHHESMNHGYSSGHGYGYEGHSNMVFGTALNLFGFFVIMRYSPKEMREYAYGLINLQFASTLCDHLMADAAAPFLLFPIYGGIPMGWMHHLGISSEIHTILCLSAIGHTQSASVCLFFTRFQLILPVGHALKCSTRFLYVFFIVMSLSSYLQISALFYAIHETNDNKTREYYRENYPELGQFINLNTFYAVPPNSVFTAQLAVIPFMIITAGMMFSFSFGCFYSLRQQASIMEMNLIKEEKKLIHALIIQVTVPILLSFTPLTAFAVWPKLAINGQITRYFPLMTLILSLHGVVNTITLLSLYKPYREAVQRIFLRLIILIRLNKLGYFKMSPFGTLVQVSAANRSNSHIINE